MDRLSCLPDEIICHILSFLRTKGCVRTSVLSKRLRFLWALVPRLDFHVDVVGADQSLDSKIISRIVLHHKHDIHTFFLDGIDPNGSEEEFKSWIVNISTRNIRDLVIRLNKHFGLPHCLFTCKTLLDLCLFGCGNIPCSGIYLPALKKLRLAFVRYESHESLAHFISACPVLEDFSIEGEVLGHCCVSSPTLTRLGLSLYNDKILNFGVKLDTPVLRSLRLLCLMPGELSVGPLDSLIEANITFHLGEADQDKFISTLLPFLGKLYNVHHLTLSTQRITVIHDSPFSAFAIKFHNLTELHLRTNMCFITIFLENANNLRRQVDIDDDDQYFWMEPKRVPACLISHLQTFRLCFFGCSKPEFDMVKHVLMNAKVLEMMKICLHRRQKKSKVVKSFALFERGSQECQLVID